MRVRMTIVAAVLSASLLLAGTAAAHVYPSKRTPGKGATVSSVKRVSMSFTGQLRSGSIKVKKKKKSGKVVSRGGMVNAVKVATKKKSLKRGKYVAVAKITSADGHVQKFKWSFRVR